jgi:hypothetical protein
MDGRGVVALYEVDVVAIAAQDGVVGRSAEHRRARDLVPVEMEDGEHRAVAHGVEKVDPLPRSRQRARLGLAITDDARHHEVGIVECSAERVHEGIAELSSFVDRTRRGGAHVARHAAGRRELAEQPLYAIGVERHDRVDLAVGAFEVHVGEDGGTAVPGDVDDVGVAVADDAVQVHVQDAEAG